MSELIQQPCFLLNSFTHDTNQQTCKLTNYTNITTEGLSCPQSLSSILSVPLINIRLQSRLKQSFRM